MDLGNIRLYNGHIYPISIVSNIDFVFLVLPQVLCKSLCINSASTHFVAASVLEIKKILCVCVEKNSVL
jgi:hypothetical protein